jgi:hypothetical protein
VERPSHLLDPERWRRRAEETRSISENMRDPKIGRILLRLAGDYDAMAEQADRLRIRVDQGQAKN